MRHPLGRSWLSSWERALHPDLLACGLGLIVWLAAARVLYGSWRERGETRSNTYQAATVLILFGFLTALMATIGRVDELPTAVVPTRYTPFAALLQLGVVLGFAHDSSGGSAKGGVRLSWSRALESRPA